MIYALHELQHAATAPPALLGGNQPAALHQPPSPRLSAQQQPRCRRFRVAGPRRAAATKAEFGLDHTVIDGEAVAVSEEIVAERPFAGCCAKRATPINHPKVLLVAPLSGHHATLLRDTVRTILARPTSISPTGSTHAWYRWPRAISISRTTWPTYGSSCAAGFDLSRDFSLPADFVPVL
ncbi:MAG: hypothetical protein M5R42_01985 [Rhodocyclaceae bacterium]|nr:hypothetical protein [Rhodocyclaceae bacterium]